MSRFLTRRHGLRAAAIVPANAVVPTGYEPSSLALDGALRDRVETIDPNRLHSDLNTYGCATIRALMSPQECTAMAALYPSEGPFRSHIHMARHGFGKGEYKYFAYPLPDILTALRHGLYPLLAPIANHWHARLGIESRFPAAHRSYLEQCHAAGQTRPTPLLLQYAAGDFSTRMFTATCCFRCRSRCSYLAPIRTLTAASLF